ncbi:hypothetical protein HYC85_030245 [Camellia sinensis]|uniref:Uncharacterized protein n=1 Tax=Camellia sinensis TaxID=4442 RepID=A0A7J7G414_CAMSI|nr:hypothetical protein HYC85_030245 [Camellia sinensis]
MYRTPLATVNHAVANTYMMPEPLTTVIFPSQKITFSDGNYVPSRKVIFPPLFATGKMASQKTWHTVAETNGDGTYRRQRSFATPSVATPPYRRKKPNYRRKRH